MLLYTMLLCCLFSFEMYLILVSNQNNHIIMIYVCVPPFTWQIIHLVDAIADAKLHYICIKKIYEMYWGS